MILTDELRIICSLYRQGEMSTPDLQNRHEDYFGWKIPGLRQVLRRMRIDGLVHRNGIDRNHATRGRPASSWVLTYKGICQLRSLQSCLSGQK